MAKGRRTRAVSRTQPTITELFDDGRAIDDALRLGVQDALRRHKLLGQRVAVWKDGRAVILEPDEIPVGPPSDVPAPRSRIVKPRPRRRRRHHP